MSESLVRPGYPDPLAQYGRAASRAFGAVQMLPTGDRPFGGAARVLDAGGVQIGDLRSTPVRVSRSSAQTGAGDVELFKVTSVRAGRGVVVQDGRHTQFGAGDLILYDTTRPYELIMPDRSELMVIGVPRQRIKAPARIVRDFTATRFGGVEGVGAMVSTFLGTVRSEFDSLDARRSGSRLGAVLAHMVDLMMADSGKNENALPPILDRVLSYCDGRLSDPELSVPTIAAAHGISPRYLYTLFAHVGVAPATYVRQQRLAAIHDGLTDPGQNHLTVAAIAARHGLVDAPHFTRIFKQAYGCSPGELRRRGTAHDGS